MTLFLDAIVRLYDYQHEMNGHILDVAEQLSDVELISVIVEGQPSVRDTLVHLFMVVQINASWWNGSMSGEDSFARVFPPQDYPDISSLRSFWTAADSDATAFIESLSADSDLEYIYERLTPAGETRRRVLWEMLLHVINHGTQHRSEVAMMLTKLGHSPGDMEIL